MFERIKSFLGLETRAMLASANFFALLGAMPTAAGIAVSPESALRSTAVFGAVKVLAETVAQLPLHLYRRLADGGRERADDHPLYPLLTDAANGWTPASEFRLSMQANLCLFGNAFAYVGRTNAIVSELIALDPRRVTVESNPVTMEPVYAVTDASGARREYGRGDILHIRTIGIRPHVGISPVEQAREAIALSLVLEQHGAGLFGRGARPAGVLKYPRTLSDELLDRLRKSFDAMHAGSENAGRTLILEGGVTFEAAQLNSTDAQYLELRRFQLQEIARIFRVPLHLLADLERTTHSNAEALGQQFLTFCLLPLLRVWQDALRITLLTPEERKSLYIEFLVDDIARADISARFTAYSQAINAGVLNPNEARAMENREPYEGGEVFTRPVNTAKVDASANKPSRQNKPNNESDDGAA